MLHCTVVPTISLPVCQRIDIWASLPTLSQASLSQTCSLTHLHLPCSGSLSSIVIYDCGVTFMCRILALA